MFKIKSLRGKFLAIYFSIILCTFFILASILPTFIRTYFIQQKKELLIEEGKVISKQYAQSIQYANDFDLRGKLIISEQLIEQLKILDKTLDATIWFVDSYDGRIAVASGSINAEWKLGKRTQELFKKVFEGNTLTSIGTFDGYFKRPVITVGVPIIVDLGLKLHSVKGAVFIHAPMDGIIETVQYMYNIILICLIISLFVALIMILVLTRKIIEPLNQMNEAAKSIADGDFNKKINIYSDDEVGQLANSFNEMAEELNKLEVLRKSFIANISHDFRSPLTSIKGFVQAILDGTIPKENQDKYLNIVLEETERLTKLTNNILDLTKMESDEIKLNIIDFDIHEVIRKILIGFEQRIIEKNIQVDLLFIQKKLYVKADMEKIQRVIYNLLDNAIKFVEYNDSITIETTVISKKAYISISDTGQGIEEESIKYIWDRFHKGDKSRGKDKKGTGLGLSIVKQIIKHHGEEIEVESQIGVGTKFTFTLPRIG